MSAPHYDYKVESRGRAVLRTGLTVAALVVVLGVLIYGGWRLAREAGAPKKKQAQQISLVRPPLPPKPPPEPERPKEQVKQEIKQPEPEQPKDDAPAPAPDLGLDAKGTAGSDGFGLVGRPGGRDITTLGPEVGAGTGRANSAFYANQLQGQVQEALNRNEKLRAAEYRALVHLWLNAQGAVTRVELAGSTGDAELDRRLRGAIEEAKKLRPPPEGMAQPIRLELVARRT